MNIYDEVADEFANLSDKFANRLDMCDFIYILGVCIGRISKNCQPDSWEVIKNIADGIVTAYKETEK